MVRKKTERTSKTFIEALGVKSIFNDKTGLIIGLLLVLLAIYICFAFFSYFSTGQADQSLVTDLRPGELKNTGQEFQNICGSLGAMISYFFISRCFGIPAFFIPAFITLCGVKMIGAYKNVNLWKWFLGMALCMIWLSITFAKFLTPLMNNQIFNPGGDHGAYSVHFIENFVGTPGLIVLLVIVLVAFLTYLTSETITVIRRIINPIGYLRDKVKFTVVNKDKGTISNTEETLINDSPLSNEEIYCNDSTDTNKKEYVELTIPNTAAQGNISESIIKKPINKENVRGDIGLEVKIAKTEEKANSPIVANSTDINTPINPREPFTKWKYPTLNLLKEYDSDTHINYVGKDELEANKNRIIKVLNDFGVQIRSIRATVGPTITLYEITPAQGIRISKIKNLEDDLSLIHI